MPEELLPWERHPCDTDESWPSFVFFRDQMAPRRLLRPGAGAGTAKLYTWFREHNWSQRVRAYDNHLDSIRREEREALLRESERDIAAKHMQILAESRELVLRELSKYLDTSRETEAHGLLKPSDLIKLTDLTIKFDRLIRGQATEQVSIEQDFSKLTDDELRALEALELKLNGG